MLTNSLLYFRVLSYHTLQRQTSCVLVDQCRIRMAWLHQFIFALVGLSALFATAVLVLTTKTLKVPPTSTAEVDLYHLLEKYSRANLSGTLRSGLAEKDEGGVPAREDTFSIAETNVADDDGVNCESIAAKWKMPNDAIPILKEILGRPTGFDYDRDRDILSLRHPLKTGGTSFSMMLKDFFSKERVFPGSGKSQWFKTSVFEAAVKEHPPDTDPDYWRNISTFYTHSYLRDEGRKTKPFLEQLRETVPVLREKRFRLMTIVRRPLDLVASRFYETRCRIGMYSARKQVDDVADCPAVNLTSIKLQMYKEKAECKAGTREERCRFLLSKNDKYFEVCGSIDKLLDGTWMRDIHYRDLMGQLPEPPTTAGSRTPTLNDVALYTIRDLGGLIDANKDYKEDFIFFVITERMKESLCLFNYYFKTEPVEERHALYKKCRPLDFWEERQKRRVEEENQFDYTVWRAANAVMDVRVAAMQLEIKARLGAGETLDQIPFLGEGCYDDDTSL
mmetsp:Transcript_8512/g.20992  ORF Transcript_8512/g.20992 Transcript_8512/m.20992 type:complete len:505 (-) Transcript_8512:2143-3657(-)